MTSYIYETIKRVKNMKKHKQQATNLCEREQRKNVKNLAKHTMRSERNLSVSLIAVSALLPGDFREGHVADRSSEVVVRAGLCGTELTLTTNTRKLTLTLDLYLVRYPFCCT